MAIKSNLEYKGFSYDSVIFKIVRVFGSKAEGWNAVFAFVQEGDEFVEKNFRGLIPIGAEWTDENPYPVLYQRMEWILTSSEFIIVPEVVVEPQPEPVIEEPEVVVPKPKRTKKVKKNGDSTT